VQVGRLAQHTVPEKLVTRACPDLPGSVLSRVGYPENFSNYSPLYGIQHLLVCRREARMPRRTLATVECHSILCTATNGGNTDTWLLC